MSETNGTIKLEAARVLQAKNALQAISNRFDDKTPFIDSYAVTRLLMRLSTDPEVMAQEKTRNDMISNFGEKDAQGNAKISPMSPRWKDFADAYQPIAEQMLELSVRRLKPQVFKHVLGVQPAETQALWPFLEEASDELAELDTAPAPPPAAAAPAPPAPAKEK